MLYSVATLSALIMNMLHVFINMLTILLKHVLWPMSLLYPKLPSVTCLHETLPQTSADVCAVKLQNVGSKAVIHAVLVRWLDSSYIACRRNIINQAVTI